jgi:nitroreductase
MAVNYNFAAIADMCIKGHDMILRDAPHVIIAYSLKADPTAASSCMIALSNLELALHAHGIGACCAGFLDIAITGYPKLQEALELPAGHSSFGAMMAGYPKFKYKRIPGRKEADISWM